MTILTLQPDATFGKDTYITAAGTQTWNYGVSPVIVTAGPANGARGLIQFALENIPPGATINSAILTLVAVAVSASTALDVSVHRALTEWTEGNANGALTVINGSSWTRREQSLAIPWASNTAGGLAGTDYSNTAAATTSITGTGTYTWDLTSEVNAMVNGGAHNYGWWLIQPSGSSKSFVSSDDSSRPTEVPKLVINYTPAFQQVLVLQPDATTGIDTTIKGLSSFVTYNNGINPILSSGNDGAWQKAMIKFGLSALPVGATIISAKLVLHNDNSSPVSPSFGMFRSLVQWFEGNKNDAAPDAGVDGSTWNLRNVNGSVAWVAGFAGGGSGSDYATTASDSQTVVGPYDYTWDVTADVQGFYSGSLTNHGWWIVTPNVGNTAAYFTSSESIYGHQRPKLIIVYSTVVGPISGAAAATSTVTGALTMVNPLVTLQPDATTGIDTNIREPFPTFNYGIATIISVGWDSSLSQRRRGLIKFDLSAIPPGSFIINATLKLFAENETISNDFIVSVYRSLTAWFEGNQNGAAPGGGQDGSTWNNKNANGAVAWGAAGGQSGVDYAAGATASALITGIGIFFNFNVTVDVQSFSNATQPNHGWWLINNTESGALMSLKDFSSSDSSTPARRPTLVVVYRNSLGGVAAGTSTVTGHLVGAAGIEGSAAGTSSHTAQIITNFFSTAHIAATSTVTGILRAKGNLHGNSFGDSTVISHIKAEYHSVGVAAGTSAHVAHLKGVFRLLGVTAGVALAVARIFVQGHIRGVAIGTSTAVATGYARAVSVAAVIGCNPVPLLHITNGFVQPNGQLNILNFLGDRAGYFLVNYRPQIAQYKDGGYWSSSPQSQGRRLRSKVFGNVIDVLEVAARAGSQDALIQYQQDLLDFQEAASDYWTSDYAFQPFYLVARAARETNIRYALIHTISCPELENPYTQPFFDDAVGAAFVSLTIRIEHGLWTSMPPGKFDCVTISGQREWTVSGWQTGS